MKRNSVFTKLLAMLLCVMMVIGCLPLSAFADQWEGDIDVVEDPEGSETNPMTPAWTWNDDKTEATASVTIPAGSTFYFEDWAVTADTTLTANGTEVTVSYGSPMLRTPSTWTLTNESEESVEYALVLSVKEGTFMNPAELILGYNDTVLAGNGHIYYYKWTAEGTGTLSISIEGIDEGVEGDIVINNNTSYVNKSLSADGFVNEYDYRQVDMPVTEGDEIVIEFTTLPDAEYNYPAATINHYSKFSYPLGSELNPIFLTGDDTVTNTGTIYYKGRFGGQTVTITGEGEFSVVYDGVTYNAVDGKIEIAVANTGFGPMAPVPTFALTGEGEFRIVAVYPAGHMDNPAVAVLGDNVASIEAGSQGYYYTYIAEKAGELVVTITAEAGWTYTINNMTAYSYGDKQWSDSDPVVNPATITVAEGDEIQIVVSTYDPADPWNAPAGTITMNLAYTPTGPVVAEDLVFQTVGVSFQEYIGLQPAILLSTAKNYQNIYLEVVQETVNGVVTEEIEGFEFYNYYLAFDKQVQSWSMADKITLTVYAEKDGKQYCSEPYTCTVEGLAIEKIKTTTNEKLKRTFVDMLNYGAAVQTRFGHNAGNLANKNLGELSALGTQTDAVLSKTNSVVDNGTIDVLQVNPSMQARVEVQFIYIGDVSKYEVRYTVDGVEQEPIPYSEFMDFYSYKVARVPIKAANMRSDCVISLYDPATGEAVSNIYHCSIEGYALEKATSDMADVYKAMMKYGDSVAAYAAG